MNSLKHKKRGLALLMIMAMVFSLLSVGPVLQVSAAEVGDVLYYEGFETTNTLQQNGDATFERVNEYAAAGTSSLRVSPTAQNNYSGVALRNESLGTPMLPGGKYKLTAKAYSTKDATMGVRVETKDFVGADTYGTVGATRVVLKANEWVDIEMEFAVPVDHRSVTSIVFHNNDQVPELTFCLDEVQLQVTGLPAPVKEIVVEEEIYYEGFETENTLQRNGDADFDRTNAYAAAGTSSLFVSPTAQNNYSGVALRNDSLKTPMIPGGKYRLTAKAYSTKDATMGVRVETKDFVGADTYGTVGATRVVLKANEWVDVEMVFAVPIDHRSVTSIVFHNNDQVPELTFYLDEVKLEVLTLPDPNEQKEIIIPEWDLSLPSIKDTYKNYFDIGNIMNFAQTADADTTAMYKHHYSVMTPENEMKPQSLSSAKGVYNYTNADTMIAWAEENDIKVHGHVLVWHAQSAAWLTTGTGGKPLTREEARSNMEEYINNVAGHFKGKVVSWDVVNEAFDGGSTIPEDWRTVLRKNSPWYLAYENGADESKGESGADYIYDAFVYARLADPDAVLCYNDYNETEAWKREAIALMTEELNEKWKNDERNTQPERLLVEVIGMQSHFWAGDLNVNDVEASIVRFAQTGAELIVTELDIPYGTYSNQHSTPLTEEEEIVQAKLYAQLFDIYKKHASSIGRVTFWGKADPQSWRGKGSPVLFDRAYDAKEAYYAVMDPTGYQIVNWENPYSDVTSKDWFYTGAAYASIKNLTSDADADAFSPEKKITWGEFLTMLYRLDGHGDTAVGDWAVSNGIVKEDFDPLALLNRQDMAVIIGKYLEYSDNKLALSDAQHIYADDAAIDASAKPAVELLYNAGIIVGKPGNLFKPADITNRAEAAAIIYRLAQAWDAAKAV